MENHGNRMNSIIIGESGHFSRNSGTPVKKLERSMNHSIDVEAIPSNLKQTSSEGAVFLFKEKNAEFMVKGNAREVVQENAWTSRLDLPLHSNGDSRRILEPPLIATRPPSGLQLSRKSLLQQEQMISKVDSPRYGHIPTAFSGLEPTQSLDRTSSISSTWSSLEGHVTEDFLDYSEAESRFLEANREYSESSMLDMVRRDQYPDLGLQRQTYMDFANFALSSKFQVSFLISNARLSFDIF